MPRPATGETPIRHVRVADKLWKEIAAIAKAEGCTVTAVVIDALKRHVAWSKRQKRASGE